ncbi:extracellular solute-binding protein [Thalassococcus sp. CAU 1522]|uniref:Extracellular solute-binding protein n=1 Tax=Thalassococcus arenae TaxID=2851652 RepID=A0ABS6N6D0_9RHOB|nr:extracellular solute-binding protein [Thalassococcus arenae]MBV2359571.1 extracellular solute-binding protein [Thalassococcus arenae]
MTIRTLAIAGAFALTGGAAMADCGISGGNISILANDFPALHAVVNAAETCAGEAASFNKNHNKDHKDLMVAALTPNPAEYSSVIVANSSLVTLMNDGLVRPLDDLVAKHGQQLNKSQLITIDGKVMAVAFMANAQHLYARSDILEQVGKPVPTTYEEVLETAQAIRDAGIMEYPFALNTKAGWNLGEEFVNMYMGTGADFFKPGTAEVAINNENGVKTLEMLKALVEFSNPDFLTYDSNATQAEWEAGNLALATLWGSRGAAILDAEGSTDEITSNTVLAAAPTWGGGTRPASTLWWDGLTISTNVSDEDAEATFIALMKGASTETVKANNDAAVWLIDGYEPGPASAGVAATAQAGAAPYPMVPFMGALHTALGDELADFLQGKESAEQALADVEAAYTTAAKEQGFLQ